MKKTILAGLIILGFISHDALASITVHSAQASCDTFPGTWTGFGTIEATIIFPIECSYKGVANVTPATDASTYNVHIELTKDSGICPDHYAVDVTGTCKNGALDLHTSYADLNGSLNEAGTQASLSGKVKVNVGGSDVTAKVKNMQLQKQS